VTPLDVMIAQGQGRRLGTVALLMAGGSGERMRSSGSVLPKPLVSILGMSLLERNVHALLRNGFGDIVVAVPAGTVGEMLADVVDRELRPLCATAGAEIGVLVESRPLGNIGGAALVGELADTVLVVFSDNLTSVDLGTVVLGHRERRCAMTLVAHHELSRLAFGRLTMSDGDVVTFEEKPEERTLISSGITVLGPDAIRLIPPNGPTGIVDLFNLVHGAGLGVAGHVHSAPWIDVNDTHSVHRAEDLVRSDPDAFAPWQPVHHEQGRGE